MKHDGDELLVKGLSLRRQGMYLQRKHWTGYKTRSQIKNCELYFRESTDSRIKR